MSDLYRHMIDNGVKIEMFVSGWLFSLFGMIIPLNDQVN